MKNTNPLYILKESDSDAGIGLWTAGGISACVMRFFKLKQQKKIFLSAYPTPESLQEKLSEIMDRNPMARKIYTKLDGMTQEKYEWYIDIELLHSWNFWRWLGNFVLSPIAMLHQGTDMVKNKYYTTAGDILNREINKSEDVDRMYYSPRNLLNVVKDKLNNENIDNRKII